MKVPAEVVICGAGIAGVALAYELAVRRRRRGIVLVDERDPLTLTSDKSSECYRNWWPGPDAAMVGLLNRSIDLLEGLAQASGNALHLNRRGYLYATGDPERVDLFRRTSAEAARQGAGPLRTEAYRPSPPEGFEDQPDGADLLLDPAEIRRHFPYLSEEVVAVLHVRRAGWFNSTGLGTYLLEQARARGVELVRGRVARVRATGGRVAGVELAGGHVLATGSFVNAAGPLLARDGLECGAELPLACERHVKLVFPDTQGVVARDAPLLIWADPQRLPWDPDEREALAEDESMRALLGLLPPGAHLRPEGGADSQALLMLWGYDARPAAPVWPIDVPPLFAEVVLRGLATMLPGLKRYIGRAPRPVLDGGYYTRTPENRPLVGPLPLAGGYVLGAFSGFGLMAACGAAELLGAHLCEEALPDYAPAFTPARYSDPAYRAQLATWPESGQL